jgi:hypothetical protein
MSKTTPVNPKPKTGSSKKIWQAQRARYTWHLHPPFVDKFDHLHWWKNEPNKAEPSAALYELVRRHPTVMEALRTDYSFTKPLPPPLPKVVWLLTKATICGGKPPLCLSKWPDLHQENQKSFERFCGTLKGIDQRPDSEKCFVVKPSEYDMALSKTPDVPNPTLLVELRSEEPLVRVSYSPPGEPITQLDREKSIGEQAALAYRSGYLLLAVAPDLAEQEAQDLLAKQYRCRVRKSKPRARWENWLPLIAAFEDGEAKGGAKSDAFNHYRRVMDSITLDLT